APAPLSGVTAKGLPFSQRGGVFVQAAGLLTTTNAGNRMQPFPPPATYPPGQVRGTLDLVAHIPVLDHTFVDLDFPSALGGGAGIGNPMVGMHHVFRPLPRLWLNLGGEFGFPLINNNAFEGGSPASGAGSASAGYNAVNAWWDAERFLSYKVPFAVRLG